MLKILHNIYKYYKLHYQYSFTYVLYTSMRHSTNIILTLFYVGIEHWRKLGNWNIQIVFIMFSKHRLLEENLFNGILCANAKIRNFPVPKVQNIKKYDRYITLSLYPCKCIHTAILQQIYSIDVYTDNYYLFRLLLNYFLLLGCVNISDIIGWFSMIQ